jgi:hypothetical protein
MFEPNGKDTAKGDVLPFSNHLRHRFAPANSLRREGGEDAENAGDEEGGQVTGKFRPRNAGAEGRGGGA